MSILETLFPACVADKEGFLYYVTHSEHAIKRLDLKNYKVEYLDNPEGYIPKQWAGVDKILLDNDNLYLFEQNGQKLLEYSLLKKSSRCFDLKCNIFSCGSWAICTIHNHVIWAFPSYANKVIKIDLINGKVEERTFADIDYSFNQKDELFISCGKEIEISYKLFSCGCKIDNEIWLFTERKPFFLKYDLSKDIYEKSSLPVMIRSCVWALYRKYVLYILSAEGKLYCWDVFNNRAELLFDSGKRYPYYNRFIVTDTNIWLIPFFGEDIYVIDLKTKRKSKYSRYPKDFCYRIEAERSKYFEYCEDKNNYYFAMHSANYLLIIEKDSGAGRWLKPIEPQLEERAAYYIRNYGMNFCEFMWDLKDWIRICTDKYNVYKNNKNIGKNIWKTIRD